MLVMANSMLPRENLKLKSSEMARNGSKTAKSASVHLRPIFVCPGMEVSQKRVFSAYFSSSCVLNRFLSLFVLL